MTKIKTLNLIGYAFFALLLLVGGAGAQTLAVDSCGYIVELKEKYGPAVYDTGTVVTLYAEKFVVTHRSGPDSFYPTENYSLSHLRRLPCVK
jgi:hypothetical protein